MKKSLKIFSGIIVVALILTGCKTGSRPADLNAKMTITWLGVPYNQSSAEGTEVEKLLEEKFNVDIKPLFYPQTNYNEKKTMLMASNDIPDIVYEMDPASVAADVQQGFLCQVDYKTIVKYAPTVYKIVTSEEPKAWIYSRVDGNNYGIPNLNYGNENGRLGLWREDWLKKVGINKVPETVDEMHEALLRFVKNDPDGNGKNDTFGMSGDISSWHTTFGEVFGAYGILPFNWMQQNGNVVYGGFANGMTDVLKLLSRWYAEGIINKDFITDNVWGQGREKFSNGIVGYINQGGGYINPLDTSSLPAITKQINDKAEVVSAKFVKGPEGKSGTHSWGAACHIVSFGAQLKNNDAKLHKILNIFETLVKDESLLQDVKMGSEGKNWNYVNKSLKFKGGIKWLPPLDEGSQRGKLCRDDYFGQPTFFVPVTPAREISEKHILKMQDDFNKEYQVLENGHTDLFLKPDTLPSSAKYFADLRTRQINLIVGIIKGEIPADQYTEKFKSIWENGGGLVLEKEAGKLNSEMDSIVSMISALNK